VEGFDSSLTVPVLPAHAATIACARASSHSRSARPSGSSSFFLKSGSNQRPS
jgi:hypothetical protein